MAITTPSLGRSRITTFTQTVMPSVREAARAILAVCVMDAARELFYPNAPRHSLELYLCRLGSFLCGAVLVQAARWRRK